MQNNSVFRIELPRGEPYWFLLLRYYRTMQQALIKAFLRLISIQQRKRKSHKVKENEK